MNKLLILNFNSHLHTLRLTEKFSIYQRFLKYLPNITMITNENIFTHSMNVNWIGKPILVTLLLNPQKDLLNELSGIEFIPTKNFLN